MSGYRTIAAKIPDTVRKALVDNNTIGQATAAAGDKNLQLLSRIWYEYIEPDQRPNLDCPKCIAGLLMNWKELHSTLVQLEAENKALQALRSKSR